MVARQHEARMLVRNDRGSRRDKICLEVDVERDEEIERGVPERRRACARETVIRECSAEARHEEEEEVDVAPARCCWSLSGAAVNQRLSSREQVCLLRR